MEWEGKLSCYSRTISDHVFIFLLKSMLPDAADAEVRGNRRGEKRKERLRKKRLEGERWMNKGEGEKEGEGKQ